jgi:hypothetical protein
MLTCILYYLVSIRGCPLAESFRHAIAATFLIVYLLLVIYNTFFNGCSPKATLSYCTTNGGVTNTLLSNFAYLTGVVVAFYFGSIAYGKHFEKDGERDRVINVTPTTSGGAQRLPPPDAGPDPDAQVPPQVQRSTPA